MSELEAIARALEEGGVPDWVERTMVEPMIDHTGDAAVRVTVIVRAGREKMLRRADALNDVVTRIHAATDAVGTALYPYTRFLAASEAA